MRHLFEEVPEWKEEHGHRGYIEPDGDVMQRQSQDKRDQPGEEQRAKYLRVPIAITFIDNHDRYFTGSAFFGLSDGLPYLFLLRLAKKVIKDGSEVTGLSEAARKEAK